MICPHCEMANLDGASVCEGCRLPLGEPFTLISVDVLVSAKTKRKRRISHATLKDSIPAVVERVTSGGAVIIDRAGGGFVAMFQGENHARRAVDAALHTANVLVPGLGFQSAGAENALEAVRIGVMTQPLPGQPSVQAKWSKKPLHTLRALKKRAAPGQVLLTGETARLMGTGVGMIRVGSARLSGVTEEVELYEARPQHLAVGGASSLSRIQHRHTDLFGPSVPRPSPRSGVTSAVRGTGAPDPPESGPKPSPSGPLLEPPSRFLHGRLPERIQLRDLVPLQVRVTLESSEGVYTPIKLAVPPEGLEVLLVVHSPGFIPRSETRRALHVPAGADSDWALFELEATKEGVQQLEVTAYHGGTYLGALRLQVTVDRQIATGPGIDRKARIAPRPKQPGEVTLQIHYDNVEQVYRYQLIDETLGGTDEIRSSRLRRTSHEAVENLVHQLNLMARGTIPYTAEQTRAWLKGKGIELWNEFVPSELQRQFWERRDRMTRIMILSEGDPVPWELLYPFEPEHNRNGGFLAEQFQVARWKFGPPPVPLLHLYKADFVVPDGSPETARSEVEAVRALFGEAQISANPPISDLTDLLGLFESATFNLLHFACHNSFDSRSPVASHINMGQQPFQPTFLAEHVERFRDVSPLVFMNACRTDGQAPLYTRLAGWAHSFLSAGAGAFVGSLWEVRDRTARVFAENFYRALIRRQNLGDAMKAAREAIREEPGDPTWLAYTIYGDPLARLSEVVSF